jgi:hypothetical protein
MGGACHAQGRNEKCVTNFGQRNNVESCGLDSSSSGKGPMGALVNTVINLVFPQQAGHFLTT